MKAFLRTLWKDMVILRWWLLAWTAAVVGFAVWRDHLAAQWDASPFDSKPDADTVQKVLLGFAAVIAVRLMHTDKLHGDFAFWRTRPTSALRLAFAKLVLGSLWLFLLPVAVEYVLFEHLEYGIGAWLATADFALRLAGALLPALATGMAIGSVFVAMPTALLLVSWNMAITPESWAWNMDEVIRPELYSWIWRLLVCLLILPFAAARKTGMVLCLALISPLPGQIFNGFRTSLDASRFIPISSEVTPTPIAISCGQWNTTAYIHDLPHPERAWLLPADGTARIIPPNSAPDITLPLRQILSPKLQVDHFEGLTPDAADIALLLGQSAKLQSAYFRGIPAQRNVPPLEDQAKATPGARVNVPVQVFQQTDPLVIDIPLTPGATWQNGLASVRLLSMDFCPDNGGARFELETAGPYTPLLPAPGALSLRGGAVSTAPAWYLVNDRHQCCVPLTEDLSSSDAALIKTHYQSQAHSIRSLNRQYSRTCRYLRPSLLNRYRIASNSALSAIAPDSDLMRGAKLVVVQWNVVRGPEQTVNWTVGKMANRRRPFGESDYRNLSPQELAEWRADPPPPKLTDPADVERYIQDCISANVSSEEGHEVTLPRLAAVGPAHFPQVMRHLAIYQGYGSSGGEDENEVLLDKTALRMAQPEHLPVLLHLLELGISMHRTLAARPWFLEAALPRLESLAGSFAYSREWVKSLADLKDPRLYPALVAWCTNGNDWDIGSSLRELAKLPAFPREQAIRQLQERCLRVGFAGKTSIGLALARWGDPAGPALAAEQFAQWPWPLPDNTATGPSFFGPYSQNLFPDLPEDVGKAIPWFATNGPKLRWTGAQWVLPPAK